MNQILIKPHLTEKSLSATSVGGYTFQVSLLSTKSQIKHAVKEAFGVHALRVTCRVVHVPAKRSTTRRSTTAESSKKLATVYLKKGESIALFEFKDNA